MRRDTVLAIGLLVLISVSPLSRGFLPDAGPDGPWVAAVPEQYAYASQYVANRFNPSVGLVSESQDQGPNALGFNPVNRTYWVASDNLWAEEALKERYPEISSRIGETIAPFLEKYGYPNLFEVVLGRGIAFEFYDKTILSVANLTIEGKLHSILYDIHRREYNPTVFRDAKEYADLVFYMALNYCLNGNRARAEDWFRLGEGMWDGRGFYDKAARSDQLYQNYKLGLFLFTQRALGFESNISAQVEAVAWGRQRLNVTDGFGGITTLSYLNGNNLGTANIETTSILLLAYNDSLTERVGSSCRSLLPWLVFALLAFLMVATAVAVAITFRRAARRRAQAAPTAVP